MSGVGGSRILVIGGAGALGAAVVDILETDGAAVVIADASLPRTSRNGVEALILDVTDAAAVDALVGVAGPRWDGIVFAAGTNTTGPISTVRVEDYERVMDVNLRGAFHVGAAIERSLEAEPRPFSAVFYASTAGIRGEYGASVYAASKFGLIGFVQCLASEIAAAGGRANSLCPGNIDSPMLRALAAQVAERSDRPVDDVLHEFAGACAFDRLIQPAEVASVAAFLVGPGSSGMSGQTVVVDGAPK